MQTQAVVTNEVVLAVRSFESAYPGSMFERRAGEYVRRDDAGSLAGGLLELIASLRRELEDALDAASQLDADVAELIEAAKALRISHNAMLARWWQQHNHEDKVLGNTASNNAGRMNEALARCGGAA